MRKTLIPVLLACLLLALTGEAEAQEETDASSRVTVQLDGHISIDGIARETICGLGRPRKCSIKTAIKLGLFETGLRPQFPVGLTCRDIDEQWAISYTHKRSRENYHGGIDMPAPYGTPMIAAANGVVVSRSVGKKSFRGKELIIRHTPEDTGIPGYWIYSQYAHFDVMPKKQVGDRVTMGEILGPTGNSGIGRSGKQSNRRRPAIHFAVWFSAHPEFAIASRGKLLPLKGLWMDPNALYRKEPPFDSQSLLNLPKDQKKVPIPVMTPDGKHFPTGTKLVWPYFCIEN